MEINDKSIIKKKVRPRFWKLFYKIVSIRIKNDSHFKFMNYGFYPSDLNYSEKYCIQLYKEVIKNIKFDKISNILEIGCGRGGGLEFLYKEYYDISQYWYGIDLHPPKTSKASNIQYIKMDAMKLKFDTKFDLIINIESSHCYQDEKIFFQNVKKHLSINGKFAFADFRTKEEWKNTLNVLSSLFIIEDIKDINDNVVNALKYDSNRRTKLCNKYYVKGFYNLTESIFGIKNTSMYNQLKNNSKIYKIIILKNKK